jgi:hypothetical protein
MTRPGWRWAVGLVVPTLVGLYLTALYNFAITGSVRPDALFLAWGPGGVTSARVGQGVLGLLLDARYGILPYVPILLLAAGGLALGGARRFAVVMPAAAAYYLTVASADNWAGAVCNLGRYFMPVAPLAVALVGMAIDRVLPRSVSSRGTRFEPGPEAKPRASFLPVGRGESAGAEIADPSSPGEPRLVGMTSAKARLVGMTSAKAMLVGMTTGKAELVETAGGPTRGPLALVLMLAAWTALFAVALWRDPHAANDSAVLLAKSTYADGNQYVPNLFIRAWGDAAPGLWARVAVWLAGLGAVAWWLARLERVVSSRPPGRGPRGDSPLATLATVGALVLSAGLFLERWPGKRDAPTFADRLPAPGVTPPALLSPNAPAVFVSGAAWVREEEAILGPGPVELLVRAPLPASSLRVTVGGPEGVLRAIGLPPLVLRPTGGLYDLPLIPYHEVRGRDGRRVAFSRTSLALDGQAVLRLGSPPAHGPTSEPPVEPDGEMEPQPGGAR